MRPEGLHTKIFLDSGDPAETREAIGLLGFLDGQTTNPSLVAKNPHIAGQVDAGSKFTPESIYAAYKGIVEEISGLIPDGSVSVEVYADQDTSVADMMKQAEQMNSWIPNAHIKFPTTERGLEAAHSAVSRGMRVNMTLCFTQEQAAAVYAATAGAAKGDVFVSPFVGRHDDKGDNGMDVIENIQQMYAQGDGHVEVLTASVRSMDHFLRALQLRSDIVTVPLTILQQWHEMGMTIPDADYTYNAGNLSPIPYEEVALDRDWKSYDLQHLLVEEGIKKFVDDWNRLLT